MPPKIGLVLGGGGSRGLAHIGVLRVLQREQIPIDFIVGTSMGAIVGAFYALDNDINEAEQNMARTMGADLDMPAILRTIGMLTGTARQRRMKDQLTEAFGNKTFADLQIPLTAMTVDMAEGQEITITDGPLVPALLASSAVPGVYPPVPMNGMQLSDGGVIDSLATHVATDHGADYVIAVDVYPKLDTTEPWLDPLSDILGLQFPANILNSDLFRGELFSGDLMNIFASNDERDDSGQAQVDSADDLTAEKAACDKPIPKRPNAPAAMWRSVRVITWHLHQQRLQANPPAVYMRPAVDHFGSLDFKDVEGPIQAGEEEAEQHIAALQILRQQVEIAS